MPTIKVDRIANREEFDLFRELGVDLFGFVCHDMFNQERWIDPKQLCELAETATEPLVYIYDASVSPVEYLKPPFHLRPQDFFQANRAVFEDIPFSRIESGIDADIDTLPEFVEAEVQRAFHQRHACYAILECGWGYRDSWNILTADDEYQADEMRVWHIQALLKNYPLFLSLEWTPEIMAEIAQTFGSHARYNFTLAEPQPTNKHLHNCEQVIEIVQFLTSFEYGLSIA